MRAAAEVRRRRVCVSRSRARWLQGAATALVLGVLLVHGAAASGQTSTTPAPSTTPTTAPNASTTAPPTTAPASTNAVTTTSAAPVTTATTATNSADSFPWLAVVVGVVVLALIIIGLTAASRRRARRQTAASSWRRRATDETAEIGAAARLLAGGTPVSAAIAQQILASLRALEDLAASAPDDRSRAATQDAHQAVRALALAVDAEHSARRGAATGAARAARRRGLWTTRRGCRRRPSAARRLPRRHRSNLTAPAPAPSLVGLAGLEPATFGPPDQRANQAAPQPVHDLSRGGQCRRAGSRKRRSDPYRARSHSMPCIAR